MADYDVAIIGAGPAGGSAGIHAAKLGLKTVILEEHKVVGEPVHCGECLSDIGLTRLGLHPPKEVLSEDVKGVRVIFPNNSKTYVNEKGYVLEKHLFEQWLIEEAKKNGAELKLNARVNAVKRIENEWVFNAKIGKAICNDHWELDTPSGKITATIIIDASGVAGVMNRLLNLNPRFKTVTGMQYELQNIPRDGYLDFYLWPRLSPGGYLWMIPKKNGRANVGLVTDIPNRAKTDLDQFIKEMNWQDKVVNKTFGGAIPSSGPLPNTVSEGLILIGDAAGFTSPLFEGGTALGLMSGKLAAETSKKAIQQNNFSKEFLKEYEVAWKKEFPDYHTLVEGKDKLYELSDEELGQVGNIMQNKIRGVGILTQIIVGIELYLNHRPLLKKGVVKVLKAFKYSKGENYGW